MQELIERGGIDAFDRLFFVDQLFPSQIDRNAQRRLRRTLAASGLQHPQLALLDREFEVLHVAIVALEAALDALKRGKSLRQRLFHRRLVGVGRFPSGLGDFLRCADAGDDVLALGVDQIFAVKLLLAGRRIAGESDASRRGLAHIAENHGLHIDRGAPAFGNVVQTAISNGALIHPRSEHRADCAPQLRVRVLRKRLAALLLHSLFVFGDKFVQIVGIKIGVERVAVTVFVIVENFLEVMMLDAQHDVAIHGDEAPIAVQSEAAIAGLGRERVNRHVVEPEIEHGVHHAGHRCTSAGAHRDEERIFAVAELLSGDAADLHERRIDLPLQIFRIGFAVLIEISADLGCDREAGRHRQAELRHLGETGAFAAEKVTHRSAAFRLAAAEGIDPFALGGFCSGRLPRDFARAPRQRFFYRLPGDFCARFGHDIMHAEIPT